MRGPSRPQFLLAASLLLAATGCASDPVGPTSGQPSAARASAGGPVTRWTIEDFLAAQGTYCGTTGNFCHPLGIGSILGWAGPTGAPAATLDFAGVNAAWYLEHFGVDVGYTSQGTVRERRLADGRRLVTANIRFANTLLAAYPDFASLDPLVGADFTEYGTVEPVTASGTVMLQMVLPADYVGLPDILQVVFEPLPGMELLQLVANVRAEGTLRRDFDGIEAGTEVRVTLHTGYLPKLIGTPAENATGLVRTFFGPSDAVRIQAIGR